MKKPIHIFLTLFFTLSVFSPGLFSETETEFAFNIGPVFHSGLSVDPFYWTTGLNMDFYVSEKFGISPELYLMVRNLEFKKSFLAPGLMLNYKFDDFRLGIFYTTFLGAGITKLIRIDEGEENTELTTDLALKLNVGFSGDRHKVTFFLITSFENFLKRDHIMIGLAYGIYFYK